jgi:hypothetical protein
MTLLERVEAPLTSQSVDQAMMAAFTRVPGALGLGIEHGPVGTRAVLVLDAEGEKFLDAELDAMDGLVHVRRAFPREPIDLLCLSVLDANAFDTSPRMAVYRLA